MASFFVLPEHSHEYNGICICLCDMMDEGVWHPLLGYLHSTGRHPQSRQHASPQSEHPIVPRCWLQPFTFQTHLVFLFPFCEHATIDSSTRHQTTVRS